MCYHQYDRLGERCFVYLIECDGYYKIGSTVEHPRYRLHRLQVGSPKSMKLICFYEGGRKMEKLHHAQFDHLRIRGEWFLKNRQILVEMVRRYNRQDCDACVGVEAA